MSNTHKHIRRYKDKEEGNWPRDFDGSRHGNNRKWISKMKREGRQIARKNNNQFTEDDFIPVKPKYPQR